MLKQECQCENCSCIIRIDATENLSDSIADEFNALSVDGDSNKITESFVVLAGAKSKTQSQDTHSAVNSSMKKSTNSDISGAHTNDGDNIRSPPISDLTSNGVAFEALSVIWEIAADQTQRDQPLCGECTTKVFCEQNRRIQEMEAECDSYQKILDEFNSEHNTIHHVNFHEVDQQAIDMQNRMEALEIERASILNEMKILSDESHRLDTLEIDFWTQYRVFFTQLNTECFDRDAAQCELEVATTQLENLRRTNVYDDAFHIYYDGHFGTINSFRLGRLPSQPVEWTEINAALGQSVLLLDTIAKRTVGFDFDRYRLIVRGSFSRIGTKTDKATYELYGSSDLNLGRFWWYRRFDTAMVYFLSCIKEIGEFAERKGPKVLQYPIHGETIKGYSIRLQFNQDEKWTKALKFMLINLKYVLAWCVKQDQF